MNPKMIWFKSAMSKQKEKRTGWDCHWFLRSYPTAARKMVQTSFMITSGRSIMDSPLARQLEGWPKIEQVEVEVYVFHEVSYFCATPPGKPWQPQNQQNASWNLKLWSCKYTTRWCAMSQLHFKRLLKGVAWWKYAATCYHLGERVKGLEDEQDELQGFVEEEYLNTNTCQHNLFIYSNFSYVPHTCRCLLLHMYIYMCD